ncbi:MAG TPA: SUMF1/EgtB/PvdO family nonheme iron enzyme [Thermoanaerobaculia bacterium]|nr:SUMF1/EgtB/PvdO family nonheme iron enzyme [Thermoanaerobaculia bacterium]
MSGLRHHAYPNGITRDDLLKWYRANRERTKELFALVNDAAYYDRPIALRNPIVFYEGHFPAFSFNTLVKLAHKGESVDARREELFARGIDPEDEASVTNPTDLWPAREEVLRLAAEWDARVEEALLHAPLEDDRVPQLRGGEAVLTILEHEQMHHETLLYMLHNLPYSQKAAGTPLTISRASADKRMVRIPRGRATLGQVRGEAFGWDNEFPRHFVDVDAFEIDAHNVTNGDYLAFVEATGASAPHFWMRENGQWCYRGLLGATPLPLDAPVYVTHDEATAYAKWKGMRLPTEAEFDRAAYGDEAQQEPLDASRGNFDFAHYDPVAIGSYEPNVFGVYDLIGNGWEWTSTLFAGFDGFEPMPSYPVYSADFFDGAHYVMKGASPVTARELVRRSFRNWFRPNYPYVYATFRCVR